MESHVERIAHLTRLRFAFADNPVPDLIEQLTAVHQQLGGHADAIASAARRLIRESAPGPRAEGSPAAAAAEPAVQRAPVPTGAPGEPVFGAEREALVRVLEDAFGRYPAALAELGTRAHGLAKAIETANGDPRQWEKPDKDNRLIIEVIFLTDLTESVGPIGERIGRSIVNAGQR